ncbi:MAG: glycosyltransferase [Eggerthellaceae bacterium]|jgi:glycosyltransferase involved in cell wall biosynthesis|nr:glycosyltransferase [Eggerthellaceae bacterium]
MKLLVITPECPYPPEKNGGVHALFNLLANCRDAQIDILYYGDKDEEAEIELCRRFHSVRCVPLRRTGVYRRVKSIIKRIPYAIYQFDENLFYEGEMYDCVLYDQFSSLQYLRAGAFRKVAFVCDSMPRYFARKGEVSRSLKSKIYYRLQAGYASRAVNRALEKCDRMAFVSESDAEYTRRGSDCGNCEIVSIDLGVNPITVLPKPDMGRSLVFSGIMDYAPNEDAVLFFLEGVFPEVKDRVPDATLYLVGKNPTAAVLHAAEHCAGVVVTGYVDSVYPFILGCSVYVSPLRFGAGVKNKVLEAMACGKASVFSPISVEGISEVEPGVNCEVAETREEWVDAVVNLLLSEDRRSQIEEELRNSLVSSRSWESSVRKLIG